MHSPLQLAEGAFWPDSAVFIDLSAALILSDGSACCTGIAVCNADGQAATEFEQGETAYFYCEFHVQQPFQVVGCGLEFRDATPRTIHGKNTFQSGRTAVRVAAGSQLRFRYELTLDVAPDRYYFSAGLASATTADYEAYRSGHLPHAALNTPERCRVVDAGAFTVRVQQSGRLPHHGLVDLPGRCELTVESRPTLCLAPRPAGPTLTVHRPATSASPKPPTIFHVTHWKAGSQWIYKILKDCVPDLIVPPRAGETQFVNWPIQPGRVYPTVYVTKQQFDKVHVPENSRRFVVIRDLRDTLVSAYFSVARSHVVQESSLGHLRAMLTQLNREEGLLYLMREWLPHCANIQTSWLEAGETVVRYGDLLESDVETLESTLLGQCDLPVSRDRFREAVYKNRFEKLTSRRRGEEDVTAHERRGVDGDWKNHFTDRVKEGFKIRYGSLLVATGYEADLNW